MRIVGAWRGPKNQERPCVDGFVSVAGGEEIPTEFVVGTSAEVTAITRATLDALGVAPMYLPAPGAKGARQRRSGFVRLPLIIELPCPPDIPYRIINVIAAAITPASLTHNVLGLDELRRLRVIVSRQNRHALLLSGVHAYQLTGPP